MAALIVVVAALAMLAVSSAVGLPVAMALAWPDRGRPDFAMRVGYMAPLLGYGLLLLVVFIVCQDLFVGTGRAAWWVAAPLLGGSAALVAFSPTARGVLSRLRGGPAWLVAVAALIVAGTHVLLPMLRGHWIMGYATGDDAARWYMIINYFQDHPWMFGQSTEETLLFPMRDRAAYAVSGATMVSLFHVSAAQAYSATAIVACMLVAVAMSAFYEICFGVRDGRERLLLWLAAGAFTGFGSAYVNVYYTGYLTHHFSVYPVLASLCFGLVSKGAVRRFGWFAIWAILLTHIYTARYPLSFAMMAGAMLLAERLGGKTRTVEMLKDAAALGLAVVVGVASGIGELMVVFWQGSRVVWDWKSIFLQKTAGYYGGDWTWLEKIWRLSGMASIYFPVESLGKPMAYGGAAAILAALALVAYWAWHRRRLAPTYAGLVFYNAALAAGLVAAGASYVLFKSALYWPGMAFVGLFSAASAWLSTQPAGSRRVFAAGVVAAPALAFVVAGVGNMAFYSGLVLDRYTKIDPGLIALREDVARHYQGCAACSAHRIYGADYSAERHLLLREFFRDYRWQPVRGPELSFEHDIRSMDKGAFDSYSYDVLLYAKVFKCDFLDLSGNRSALFSERGPFALYDGRASIVEAEQAFQIGVFGPYDEARVCNRYAWVTDSGQGKLRFVNKGGHDWLRLEVASTEAPKDAPRATVAARTTAGEAVGPLLPGKAHPGIDSAVLVLNGLRQSPVTSVDLAANGLGGRKLAVTRVDWGYGAPPAGGER